MTLTINVCEPNIFALAADSIGDGLEVVHWGPGVDRVPSANIEIDTCPSIGV